GLPPPCSATSSINWRLLSDGISSFKCNTKSVRKDELRQYIKDLAKDLEAEDNEKAIKEIEEVLKEKVEEEKNKKS
ncbi:hypothetical protein ACQKKE_07435, partial [Desemzia incerta]|uniref:hypothetical protein n=1 Tax=Desemzia incerta TaxID=82801 RepID=UPI003D04BF74